MGFEDGLIAEVRRNECLYKLSSPNFNDVLLKERVWQNISYLLGIPHYSCKKRWKTLRKNYKRNKQRLKHLEGRAATEAKGRWKYFQKLSFLDDDDDSIKDKTENSDDDMGFPEEPPPVVSSPTKDKTENADDVVELPSAPASDISFIFSTPLPKPEETPSVVQEEYSKVLDAVLLTIDDLRLAFEQYRTEGSTSTIQLMIALGKRLYLSGLPEHEIDQLILFSQNYLA